MCGEGVPIELKGVAEGVSTIDLEDVGTIVSEDVGAVAPEGVGTIEDVGTAVRVSEEEAEPV